MNPEHFRGRVKSRIRQKIVDSLYWRVSEKQKKRLIQLTEANNRLLASGQQGFMYKGTWYSAHMKRVNRLTMPRSKNRLHPRLHPEMEEYLNGLAQIEDEETPYVLGYITKVLNASETTTDLYLLLPEALHKPIQESEGLYADRSHAFNEKTATAFMEDPINKKGLDLLKTRLMLNLLDQ